MKGHKLHLSLFIGSRYIFLQRFNLDHIQTQLSTYMHVCMHMFLIIHIFNINNITPYKKMFLS